MPTFREDTKIGGMVPLMRTDDYSDKSVTEKKLADGSITSEKLSKNVKDLLSAATGLPDDLIDSVGSMDSHIKDLSNRFPVKGSDIDVNAVSYDKLDKSLIVGQKGGSERSVMSQGAVSRELESLESNIPVPDEEDLTSIEGENNKLRFSFADRSYSPQNFSGKGYKILRKNITPVSLAVTKIVVSSVPTADGYLAFIINGIETHVDVVASTDITTEKVAVKIASKLTEAMTEYEVNQNASTVTLTRKFGGKVSTPSSFSAVAAGVSCIIADSTKMELRNIITPVMINQPNTIYEIRYDFNLDGHIIEIPEECTLVFNGGELTNGTIISNNTKVEGSPKITKLYGFLHNEKNIRYDSNQKLARTDFDVIDPIIPYSKSSIDICCNNALKSGVEKMQMIYYLTYNNKVEHADNITFWKNYSIKDCVDIIKANGLKIYSLKFHKNQGFSNDASDEEMNNYVEYVKDIVLKYLECTKDLKIIYISNEESARTSEGNNWNNYHFKLIDWLHEKGLYVGISCNNIGSTFSKISEELLNKIDIIGVNFYPYISFCGFMCKKSDIPTYINNINITCRDTLSSIYNRKANAKIVFSECGCMPYEYGLRKPYSYTKSELGEKDDSGIIQYIYHAVCLPVAINNNVLEYYRWFQDGIEFDKQEIHNLFNSFIFK